jgi:small subunit ribosomal protein S11
VPKGAKAKNRKETTKKKKTLKVTDVNGIIHVKSSFNNTMITVTDRNGNVVTWASGGTTGVKGTRKGTAFASGQAAVQAAEKAIEAGLKKVEIWVRGPGSGREAAVRALQSTNLEVTAIKDQTRIPHNGCRPSKRRRRG